ncbi:uncharacterized protein LOC126783458 [Argentina anserina]|uniref:uncharacterized protein LOC126783458 n=1 Tax=Argentina anserina TaxID=57926 RepID=UPI0021764517|nr:uncharacterized protein LOC126783458 [Potentilla anserina]
MLQDNPNDLIERKVIVMNELQSLRERVGDEGAKAVVDKLVSLKKSLKELKREEGEVESVSYSELEYGVRELEEQIENGCNSQSLSDRLNRLMSESEEKIDSAKKEFGARLRAVLAVQRKIDDVPCQSELIQYDHQLTELNGQIQGKLGQTRKYYATYNALLEIKEMMLKEASLLNSISSQFQDAITSTDGRMKLINSMEGILKGSQQKLKKVEQGLQEEQKVGDALKERHVAATAEQRRCYSLLKAFQEECGKNELLRKSSI